jgi:hypothetical protein
MQSYHTDHLHSGTNALRETSCIVNSGRAGTQSDYFVEKGISFPLIDISRDPRSQREKLASLNSKAKIIRIHSMEVQSLAKDTREEAFSPAERPLLFHLFRGGPGEMPSR